MIAGIEMFLGVEGKQVGMEMTEYQMAANSIGVTRRLAECSEAAWDGSPYVGGRSEIVVDVDS